MKIERNHFTEKNFSFTSLESVHHPGPPHDLQVIEVEGKGRGVAATRPFAKGELVCEYSGELISQEEARHREDEYTKDSKIGCYMYYFEYKSKRLWSVTVCIT